MKATDNSPKVTKLPNGGELIEYSSGCKYWYLKGFRHREDGPAIEDTSGNKYWFIMGALHREDGPAIEYPDGLKKWYLNDERIPCTTQKQFEQLMRLKAFW
jgi:hypothetical protein